MSSLHQRYLPDSTTPRHSSYVPYLDYDFDFDHNYNVRDNPNYTIAAPSTSNTRTRHNTRLESLTRTVKTYVPSSIPSLPTTLPSLPTNLPSLPSNLPSLPTSMGGLDISIPSAVSSPPWVSRPGAFGSMTSPLSTGTNQRQRHHGQPA